MQSCSYMGRADRAANGYMKSAQDCILLDWPAHAMTFKISQGQQKNYGKQGPRFSCKPGITCMIAYACILEETKERKKGH